MKAALEFDLPEESHEHMLAVRSGELSSAVSDVLEYCRSLLKHGHGFKTPEEAIEATRERLDEAAEIVYGE